MIEQKTSLINAAALCAALCGACALNAQVMDGANAVDKNGGDIAALRAGFANPPAEAKPLTWWHWINGSVSKEGIEKDFKYFKESGMGGVQLLNANMYVPDGPLRFHTEAWFEYVNFAIAKAAEYGLEFDIMNADGWANSGGPWITPEMSMKRVIWSETEADGGKVFEGKLPQPSSIKEDFYKDIGVYIVPADPAPDGLTPKVSEVKGDKGYEVVFEFERPAERRLLEFAFYKTGEGARVELEISASEDGQTWRKVGAAYVEGAIEKHEVAIPFEKTKAKFFKAAFTKNRPAAERLNLKRFALSNMNRISIYNAKTVNTGFRFLAPDTSANASNDGAIKLAQVTALPASAIGKDGEFKYKLPAGRWTILRIGFTSTGAKNHPVQPEGKGLEVDKMSEKYVRFHIEQSLGRTIAESKKYIGKSFKGILLDSWEVGTQNWTDDMPQDFKAHCGYDINNFMPAVTGRVIESGEVTNAFLYDFRRTIATDVATKYFGGIRKYAHEHGLILYGEPYPGRCFNEMQAGNNLDVCMKEFWLKGEYMGGYESIKNVSSVSHITGRKVTGAESFTAHSEFSKWSAAPYHIKPAADLAFCSGLNRAIYHTSAHQPNDLKPGFSLGRYGTHFGRANTWSHEAKNLNNYIARSQFMLQSGVPYAEILSLRSADISMVSDEGRINAPRGYDYEIAIPEFLKAMKIEGKEIVAESGAMRFKALITLDMWEADSLTLQKIKEAKDAGIPVLGFPPDAPDNLFDATKNGDARIWFVKEIWPQGRGQKYPQNYDFEREFIAAGIGADFMFADFKDGVYKNNAGSPKFIHRKYGKADIYFVANTSEKEIEAIARFKVTGKTPKIWSAVKVEESAPAAWNVEGDYTQFKLKLAVHESVFVVFEEGGAPSPIAFISDAKGAVIGEGFGTFYMKDGKLAVFKEGLEANYADGRKSPLKLSEKPFRQEITQERWKVKFVSPFNETFTQDFPKLKSWGDFSNQQIKYFSGTGTYYFSAEADAKVLENSAACVLDLGKVYYVARVRVNGKDAGAVWTYPYALDIKNYLKAGVNTFEVEVTSNFVNRMIADEKLPQDTEYEMKGSLFNIGRLAKFPDWYGKPELEAKRARKTWAIWKHFDGTEATVNAGLAGPITLNWGAAAQ